MNGWQIHSNKDLLNTMAALVDAITEAHDDRRCQQCYVMAFRHLAKALNIEDEEFYDRIQVPFMWGRIEGQIKPRIIGEETETEEKQGPRSLEAPRT